jgi:glycerate kinase
VIETAAASGLALLPEAKRNPMLTSSYGTGELIIAAIENGVREIIIGLGGSATVDGGAGMAQALGARFRDARGHIIRQCACGGMLDRIAAIDMRRLHPGIARTRITIAADVDNRICGRRGAARVFGPQKGATPAMCSLLDRNLRHFARVLRRDLKINVLDINGGGAAGGLAAGLVAFTNTGITSGTALVARLVEFDRYARNSNLIITGEGHIDAQTGQGKVVSGIARMGKRLRVPVIAIAGGLSDDARYVFDTGISGLASAVARPMSAAAARTGAAAYLANAAERAMRCIAIGKKL